MLKDILYTGLGGAAVLKERVEEEVQKLHEKGKLTASDVQSFIESLNTRGKDEEEKMKQRLKESLKEVIEELGLATKEDIETLKRS